MFVDGGEQRAFALHPVPTSGDVLAILDQIVRRIVRRLTAEAHGDELADRLQANAPDLRVVYTSGTVRSSSRPASS